MPLCSKLVFLIPASLWTHIVVFGQISSEFHGLSFTNSSHIGYVCIGDLKRFYFIKQVLKLFLETSVETSNLRSDYSTTVFNNVTSIICGMELEAVKESAQHFIQTMQVKVTLLLEMIFPGCR